MNEFNQAIADIVHSILTSNHSARDSDESLYFLFLKYRGYDPTRMTVMELLKVIDDGQLESFDTVSRMRRKVQELEPSTRGIKYTERLKRQSIVQTELFEFNERI